MAEREIPFEGGNISQAVRVGATVRRRPGPWTPTVHGLLRHLERAGFDGAPHALGFDERGREVLTYLEGRTGHPSLRDCHSDEALVAVARLVRRYHDAVADFAPPADAAWQFTIGAPRAGAVICHNDLGPWNIVFDSEGPIALIDWDFAAPGPRAWDVAYALWRFAPLYSDEVADEGFGPPADRARRMALFCDAYGLIDRRDLLATIERRMRAHHATVTIWGRDGVPGFTDLWRDGHAGGIARDLAYLRRHRATLAAALGDRRAR